MTGMHHTPAVMLLWAKVPSEPRIAQKMAATGCSRMAAINALRGERVAKHRARQSRPLDERHADIGPSCFRNLVSPEWREG